MTAYLDEMQPYAQKCYADGNEPSDAIKREMCERHAMPLILAQGDKFFSTEIRQELGIPDSSLGPEQQWVQSLCESMTRKGPVNGRMLFQSKDRPGRFFWIVDEE